MCVCVCVCVCASICAMLYMLAILYIFSLSTRVPVSVCVCVCVSGYLNVCVFYTSHTASLPHTQTHTCTNRYRLIYQSKIESQLSQIIDAALSRKKAHQCPSSLLCLYVSQKCTTRVYTYIFSDFSSG